MKTSNKLLLALLVGFILAILANNFAVKIQYKKITESGQSASTKGKMHSFGSL